MKTVKFYTLGCKANQYDTQNIRERLLEAGLREVKDCRRADIYIINTCTVTHKADRESLYYIHRAYHENPKAKIIVTGCLVELDSRKIKEQDGLSLIVSNRAKNTIANRIAGEPLSKNKGISFFEGHTRAFLKIQDGCNNFCSYCKVGLVRGKSRSKPVNEIIDEAKRLVQNGYKEIVLTGICLGSYGRDLKPEINLVRVIDELEKIDGLFRLRLSSIEGCDVSGDLIKRLSSGKKLCRHLHIPIQSGDDKILRRMNRKYLRRDYSGLFRRIKSAVPGIAITTDVLVGFPGENEHGFRNTVFLIRKILPLRVHIFPYSPREYTPAYNFPDKVSSEVVKRRILRLKEIARESAYSYQKKFLGKKVEVLIEDKFKENPVFWQGYTDNYIKVLVKSEKNLGNQIIPLKIKKIVGDFVFAE
jgi:threonylcarbamoyladenosine tRNA methylthiotransferase MtaB